MTDILHVPYTYFPDSTGGTETYVAALARGLRMRGFSSAIAAPLAGNGPREYEHEGSTVHRFGTAQSLSLAELHGTGDPVAAAEFGEIIATVRPRIVHLHAWTSGISLRLLRCAHASGIPVVFTYHTPTVSCARGSLMIYGERICDGALLVDRCSRCVLQQHGVPLGVAWALGKLPPGIGRGLGTLGLEGGAWTALRMSELMEERHTAFRHLVAEADEIVAVQDWVFELLLFLGTPRSRLTLSRLALPATDEPLAPPRVQIGPRPAGIIGMRLAYFGRIDPLKGIHIVMQALKIEPQLPVSVDIFGAPSGPDGERYLARLRADAVDDGRITFHPPVAVGDVVQTMRAYDAVVVPSIWMETGPLVVPEALAAGIPVLASNHGGIPSFLRDEVDALLLPPGDHCAWAAAFRRIVYERGLLARLTAGIRPPETMDRVIDEMVAVYRRRVSNLQLASP